MIPVEIESKGNGLSGSMKVISMVDSISWTASSSLLIPNVLRSGCLYFCD